MRQRAKSKLSAVSALAAIVGQINAFGNATIEVGMLALLIVEAHVSYFATGDDNDNGDLRDHHDPEVLLTEKRVLGGEAQYKSTLMQSSICAQTTPRRSGVYHSAVTPSAE